MNRCCISCGKSIEDCICYNYSREQIIVLLNENKKLKIRLEEMKNTSILINEINKLKAQLEKAMNCQNCKHKSLPKTPLFDNDCTRCFDKNNWESI